MTYKGNPVPVTTYDIGGGKISDGKSVRVTVPENTTIEAGKFYLLDGWFGCAYRSVVTEAGETADAILSIEQAEYETNQVNAEESLTAGTVVYWDSVAGELTESDGTGANRKVGRVTDDKDANGVIWFVLGPQV